MLIMAIEVIGLLGKLLSVTLLWVETALDGRYEVKSSATA